MLDGKFPIDMESLIDTGFISNDDANFLINCIKENKNIVIIGDVGSGKTTLARNLLLSCIDSVKIYVFERLKKLGLKGLNPSENIIESESENISLQDIINATENGNRVVIGDAHSPEAFLGLVSAVNAGCSVLATITTRRTKFIDCADSLFVGDIQKFAKETLEKNEFIQVEVGHYGEKRIVRKITKITPTIL